MPNIPPLPKFDCPMCGTSHIEQIRVCYSCGEAFFEPVPNRIPRQLADRFRRQVRPLAVAWLAIGILSLLLGLSEIMTQRSRLASPLYGASEADSGMALLMGVNGVLWIVSAIMTWKQRMWSVILGLILSYLSFFGGLITSSLFALLIHGFIIAQAHRVQGIARQIRNRGVSPHEV